MSSAECIQEPLPKKQKLDVVPKQIAEEKEEEEASAAVHVPGSGGARAGESGDNPEIMWGGKFLKEADVGITQYISSQPGFFAILKQRYSDFLVHEIASDGRTVRLTDFSPPPLSSAGGGGEEGSLADTFSSGDIERLRELSSGSSGRGGRQHYIDIQAGYDKEKRTAMHKAIKTHFPSLSSTTKELGSGGGGKREEGKEDGAPTDAASKVIRVWAHQGSPDERNTRWPGGKNKYCKFVLYKENRDTVDVIGYLARQLWVKSSVFHSAGLKDRRAVTSQQYTAFKVSAEKLLALNGSLKNVRIGNTEYVSEALKLGQLSGNRFTVVLRSVSCDDHVINDKMTSLRDVGFINYYGMQRFGTSTVPTYHVGRCILDSDWKGAVDAILMPRSGESEDLTFARKYYMSTRDVEGALRKLPGGRPLEKLLLQGLAKREKSNDYLGALKCIPFSSRLMYVHSYQSLVWNRVVTHRIQEHGFQPIPGDLVPGNGNGPQVLTEETLPQYTLHDVILPLPGYDITLPNNDVAEQYRAILAEDRLTLQNLKHKVRDFTLHGSYRHIVVKPKDVEWDILLYDDVTVPLALTDTDVLDNKPPPQSTEGGKLKAVRMSFSLPPASYATMAVRELLKMETSSHYQTQLNHSHSPLDPEPPHTD